MPSKHRFVIATTPWPHVPPLSQTKSDVANHDQREHDLNTLFGVLALISLLIVAFGPALFEKLWLTG
jgi:hypothetical protein